MVTRRVRFTRRAKSEVTRIVDWLSSHSPDAVLDWSDRFRKFIDDVEKTAESWPIAPESGYGDVEVRQFTFKTKNRRAYRVLFTISNNVVLILNVRAPGQDYIQFNNS